MILKLQNQCTLALNGLVEKALAVGGDPKHIELTSVEAFDLLRELKSNKDVLRHYTYSDEGFGFRISGADVKEIDVIANEWYKRKIGINFKDHPLYIVVPRVKKELSKKFSRNRKPLTNK